MKKIFSAVAALGLVAGVASTAAAVDFSVTGEYSVTGQYLSDTTDWGTASGGSPFLMNGVNPFEDGDNAFQAHSSDAYWLHTFKILPTMKVNDKISMFSDIRLAYDSVWGSQDDSTTMSGGVGTTTGSSTILGIPATSHSHSVSSSSNNLTNNFDIHKIYMEYMSPIGKFRMGRTPAGAWEGGFLNTDGHADRLMYWPGFVPKPFSLYVFLEKQVEEEGYNPTTDADDNLYEIGASWANEKARVALAWDHFVGKSASDPLPSPYSVAADTTSDRVRERIKAFGKVGVGMFYGLGEVSWDFGDWQDFNANTTTREDVDLDSLAYMLAAGLKMGKFDTHLAWVYAEGDGADSDDADEFSAAIAGPAGTGLGADFNPLYIWTGKYTGAFVQNGDWSANPVFTNSGCKVLALFADYQLTDKLALHGAIATGWADAPEFIANQDYDPATAGVQGFSSGTPDDHYGYEFDLGASYKLMDNLTYDIHLGYMLTGDYFDDIADATLTNATSTTADDASIGWDTHDIYMVTHSLTMSF